MPLEAVQGKLTILFRKLKMCPYILKVRTLDNIVGNHNFLFFSFFIHADSNFWGTGGNFRKQVLELDRSPESTA